jgi:NAD-dependent DNA ligase
VSKIALKDLLFTRDITKALKTFQTAKVMVRKTEILVGSRYKSTLEKTQVFFTPLAVNINEAGECLILYQTEGMFSARLTKVDPADIFLRKLLNKKPLGTIRIITKALPNQKIVFKTLLKTLASFTQEDLNKVLPLYAITRNPTLVCAAGRYLSGEELPIELLMSTATTANRNYHNVKTKESTLTDNQYDALKEIIIRRDPKQAKLLEKVGAPVAKSEKRVTLEYPMGSLRKTKPDNKSVGAWVAKAKDSKYVLSDKLDGISLQLKYKKGTGALTAATTRGDGLVGQDVLRHVQSIPGVPKKIPETTKDVSVRAEGMLGNSAFEALKKVVFKNERTKEPYTTARNMAGGMFNRNAADLRVLPKMTVTAYCIMSEESTMDKETQLKTLKKWGFSIVPYAVVPAKDLNEGMLVEYVNARRKKADYEMDGAVVEVNSALIRKKLGNETEELKPRYARAFKTGDTEQVEAIVDHVEWRLSKDGFIKPRVWIVPTRLGGVRVNKATAFNAKFILDNKVGPGAKVLITRAGDVIPHILKVVTKAARAQMPDKEGFGDYDWNETYVDLVVTSGSESEHSAVKIKQILFFFKSIGVDDIGPGVVDKFYHAGYDTVDKVLNMSISNIKGIEGFQQKSAENIFENIRKGLDGIPIYILAAALPYFGRNFGTRRMKALYRVYGDEMFSRWTGKTKREVKEEVSQIPGFKNFSIQFGDGIKQFNTFLKANAKVIKLGKKPERAAGTGLQDARIVFTGFRDKTLEKVIEDNGGIVSGSVSAQTTYLIAKDPSESGGKLDKARKSGVSVIGVEQFKKILAKKGISI